MRGGLNGGQTIERGRQQDRYLDRDRKGEVGRERDRKRERESGRKQYELHKGSIFWDRDSQQEREKSDSYEREGEREGERERERGHGMVTIRARYGCAGVHPMRPMCVCARVYIYTRGCTTGCKTWGFPSQFMKSTKVLMATPQGRRLGYHAPWQSKSQTRNLRILDPAC